MGQYWYPVNLDKKEFVNTHALGTGLKLREQLASHPGTGAALIILCAAMPEVRGGGDFDWDKNWHGPERKYPEHNLQPPAFPQDYQKIAKRTIGRWAGDRIALVGDYAKRTDLPARFKADKIYAECDPYEHKGEYKDITSDVAKVIEHELRGNYVGEHGHWKKWEELKTQEDSASA